MVNTERGKTTELPRPIQHIIPLQLRINPDPATNDPDPELEPRPETDDPPRQQPRRTAAIIGEMLRKESIAEFKMILEFVCCIFHCSF